MSVYDIGGIPNFLSGAQVANYASGAGFTGNGLVTAIAVSFAEVNSHDANILNDTPSTGDLSVGLWQINYFGSLGPGRTAAFGPYTGLVDPALNAHAAFVISSSGTSFTPWSTFNSGAYLQYMGIATALAQGAVAVGGAEALMFGVDRCAPFTSAEVAVLIAHGVQWVGGYIGGPAAACVWAPSDVTTLRTGGINLFAPIWVGPQGAIGDPHGNATANATGAVAAMQAFGLSGLIVADIEQLTWDANPTNTLLYAQDWCAQMVRAGYIAGVYCNHDLMAAMLAAGTIGPGVANVVGWLADWTFVQPTQPLPDGATAQQWANNQMYSHIETVTNPTPPPPTITITVNDLSAVVDFDTAPPSFFGGEGSGGGAGGSVAGVWSYGGVEMGTAIGTSGGGGAGQQIALPMDAMWLTAGTVDEGVDYAAPGGTPEYAMGEGDIIQEGISGFGPWAPVLSVTVGPLAGKTIYYGHAGPNLKHVGDHVLAGEQITIIGYGIVGISTGPHLEIGFYPPSNTPGGAPMLALINEILAGGGGATGIETGGGGVGATTGVIVGGVLA